MFNKQKGIAFLVIASVCLFVATTLTSCASDDFSQDKSNEVGNLQVSFLTPDDVVSFHIALYRGTDETGDVVETQIIPPTQSTVLWPDLHGDHYFVTGEAFDKDNVLVYEGHGGMEVENDVTNLLHVILNQVAPSIEGNTAPTIDSIYILNGRTVLATDIEFGADQKLYIPAPEEGQTIGFNAKISDVDGDPIVTTWLVKDGPRITDSDTGTIEYVGDYNGGSAMSWNHTVEGKYWVQLYINDGRGGSAAFVFSVHVWGGEGDLQVDLGYNSYPSIAIEGRTQEPQELDLSDGWIWLTGTVTDPDGDAIVSTNWSLDCAGAAIAEYYTDLEIGILPTETEVCTATFTAADNMGFNTATYRMNIRCVPVSVPGDYWHPAKPLNLCSLDMLLPLDPLQSECYLNSWECGIGLDSWGVPESCGTCPPAGRPADVTCMPDQSCGPCIPIDPDPCATAGWACNSIVDSCGNTHSCGTCSAYWECEEVTPGAWGCVPFPPDYCLYMHPYANITTCRQYPQGVTITLPVPGETPRQNCEDHNPVSTTDGNPGLIFTQGATCDTSDAVGVCDTHGILDFLYGASSATCNNCDPAVIGSQAEGCERAGGVFECWLSGC